MKADLIQKIHGIFQDKNEEIETEEIRPKEIGVNEEIKLGTTSVEIKEKGECGISSKMGIDNR